MGRAWRFYLALLKNFFESQLDVLTGKKDRAAAQAAFMDKTVREELAFAGNGKVYSTKSSGDALAVANRVMNAHREMLDALSAEERHSTGTPWDLQQGSPLQFNDGPGNRTRHVHRHLPVEERPQRPEDSFRQVVRGEQGGGRR